MATRMMRTGLWAIFLGLIVCVPMSAAGIKLYLKDGTYQLVKTFKVEGNRVRYYSLERGDWEEVPKSLVDFSATRRGEEQEKATERKILEQARRIEHQRFDSIPATGYQIKPGIGLPTTEGVYLFDGNVVWPLVQSAAKVERDRRRLALSLALPAPLLKDRTWVVLEGAKAAVRVAARRPIFFIEATDNWGTKAVLIPLKILHHNRLALIMCDVNYFKRINDRYGHLMGDYVLAQVATILKYCVRGSDYIVRYGGDEFVIILPETEETGANIVLQRIHQKVAEWDRENRVGEFPISVSLGLYHHVPGQAAEKDLAEADSRMYQAKQALHANQSSAAAEPKLK